MGGKIIYILYINHKIMNNILTFEKFTYNHFVSPIYTLTENTTYFDFSGNGSVYESSNSGSTWDRIDEAINILKQGLALIPYPPASIAVSITHGVTYLGRGLSDTDIQQQVGYFATGFMEILMSFLPGALGNKIKGLGKINELIKTTISKLASSGKLVANSLSDIVKLAVHSLQNLFSEFIVQIVQSIPSPDDIKKKIEEVLGMETVKTVLGDLIGYIKGKISGILNIYGNFHGFMKKISTSGN